MVTGTIKNKWPFKYKRFHPCFPLIALRKKGAKIILKHYRFLLPLILIAALAGAAWWQQFSEKQIPDTISAQSEASIAVEDELNLLARLIAAEAGNEPYDGQVAVGAVVLNRVKNPSFPTTISSVIYEPWAFECVHNGLIWRVDDLAGPSRAAADALNGWDPSYGATFFWNPYKSVSGWVWERPIITQIGTHVFAF